MLHNTITILMTSAVMLHALLGCCAHHVHACDNLDSFTNEVSCSHGSHSHQHDEGPISSGGLADAQQDDQQNDDESCDEAECSFVSTNSNNDATFAFSFALWIPLLEKTTVMMSLREPDCLLTGMAHSPDQLFSEHLCAETQVWLL